MENHLHVQWKHHQEGVLKFLEELQATETFVDVTLCCEGQRLKAHRVVLSACSPYLQQVLVDNPGEHATIILHDIGAEEMRSLLRFMYSGSASLPRRCLRAFLRAAHALQVSVLMPGAEHALTEEISQSPNSPPINGSSKDQPIPPQTVRPAVPDAMLPHDLSTTSGVKTELEQGTSNQDSPKRRRHCTSGATVRPPEAPPVPGYQNESSWSSAFREGLMGHVTIPTRPTLVPPRPTPVVKSPWTQRMGSCGLPWRASSVIAPVRPPTPPASTSHVEPMICQASSRDLLTVPGVSSDRRNPFCCGSSQFCTSPSSTSSAYSSACSWTSHSPSALHSSLPPTLLPVTTKSNHTAESPAEGTAALALTTPDLRTLSPNPAPVPNLTNPSTPTTKPSPPSSPSRFTLKQRRLRDFYRSLQSTGNTSAEDSQSSDKQLSTPLENKDEDSLTVPASPIEATSPSRPPWPGSSSPAVEQSVIRLSTKSAFQPPLIVVSPPQSKPETPTTEDINGREERNKSPLPALPSLITPIVSTSTSVSLGPPTARSPSGSGGTHTCETCGKTFGRRQLLEQHRRTHTGEKPFECSVCGKSFTQRGHWSVHQRLHDGSRPHVCPVCGKAFVSRASLKVHHRTHTGEKPFRCEDCGKQFSQLRNFKYHRSVHEGTREFACTCPECGKQFNDRGYLSSHLKIHRNRKEYACEHCEKRFNQRVAYNMHVRIHTGEKPHACGVCGKRFGRKMLLRQHARTHTGERPFRCAVCGKAFADRSNMALHSRLHSGEKPHSCELCGKAFTKKHHLKTHMNFHTGVKPYACQRCGLRFSQSSNMRTHAKKCTAEVGSSPAVVDATSKGLQEVAVGNQRGRNEPATSTVSERTPSPPSSTSFVRGETVEMEDSNSEGLGMAAAATGVVQVVPHVSSPRDCQSQSLASATSV